MNYIVANWKSNKTFDEVWSWFDDFAQEFRYEEGKTTIVAPSFPFLFEAKKKIDELGLEISLSSQDVSGFPFGAYTGAVSSGMLKEVVEYAIVGHSERREYFHETDQEIANKVRQLQEAGIKPILCVDEPYAQSQMAALDSNAGKDLIVAYEPLEAIGSGKPQEPELVKKVVDNILNVMGDVVVLYGGSVKEANAKEYMDIKGVNGLLVGGASLDGKGFAELCRRA